MSRPQLPCPATRPRQMAAAHGASSADAKTQVCLEDFECAVCTDALWDPVRLPCGHAFCRRPCLSNVLRHGSHCPLCRARLPPDEWLITAPCDATVDEILREHQPETWERRRAEADARAARCVILHITSTCADGSHGSADLGRQCAGHAPVHWTLSVSMEPVGGRSGSACNVAALFIDAVRVSLPDSLFWIDDDGEREAMLECEPYELTRSALSDTTGAGVAILEVDWRRRLRMPLLRVEHQVRLEAGVRSATQHEVELPEGLTLERVIGRSRPKARVGIGTAAERHIY